MFNPLCPYDIIYEKSKFMILEYIDTNEKPVLNETVCNMIFDKANDNVMHSTFTTNEIHASKWKICAFCDNVTKEKYVMDTLWLFRF